MKPIHQAQQQCDCYQSDGTCLGITLNDQLKAIRFLKENSKCLLSSEPIKRCQHFEQAILPYRPDNKCERVATRLKHEWAQASHEYRIKTGYMSDKVRLCPQCRTARIGEGRRICDSCKSKNRIASKAISDHKRNTESNSHS